MSAAGPEARIEREAVRRAKKAGWLTFKLTLGARGGPDRLFLRENAGRTGSADRILIEFKAPGEVPTRQQEKRRDELRSFFDVFACSSLEDACRILGLPL